MKGFLKKGFAVAIAATVILIPFSSNITARAEGKFDIKEAELTVETGQVIELSYENANGEIKVGVCNEFDQEMWTEHFNSEGSGVLAITMPECNPLTTAYLHIINGEAEEVVKVSFVKPHEHQPHLVEFIRPTETEPGRMEYFTCDCGKAFEDKACTKEIENPEEWAYLAPVPREDWGEGNPVPYIPEYDDKNITDPAKPSPTWTEEQVEEYYEQEEAQIQEELEGRKNIVTASPDDKKSQLISNENIKEDEAFDVLDENTQKVNSPMMFTSPSADVEVEAEQPVTFWEKIKMFFEKIFNI